MLVGFEWSYQVESQAGFICIWLLFIVIASPSKKDEAISLVILGLLRR
jgi:hypothetical protein